MGILFKNRNFILVYLGLLVSSIGDVLFTFAMGLYVLDITHSATKLALYSSIGAITWLVLTPLGGVLTDRWDKVKIMYITDFIRGITVVVAGILLMNTENNDAKLYILYVISFIIAANGALFAPATQSIIPTVVKKEDLVHANSLMSLSYNVKDVFGMLLAGVLFAILGPIKIVFINGVSYILSAISEMFIKQEIEVAEEEKEKKSVIKEFKEGILYIVYEKPEIIKLLGITNLISLAILPIQAVAAPYLFNEQIGAPDMHLSFIYAAVALGGILGSLYVSKKALAEKSDKVIKNVFISMVFITFMQLALYRLFANGTINYGAYLTLVIVLFALTGIVNILFNVPVLTHVQKSVESNYYGRVMALFSTISAITVPFSITFGGLIVDNLGVNYIFLFSMIVVIIALVLLKINPEKKKTEVVIRT